MINLIIKDRGKGKTSDLIRLSARTGIPIVCSSPEMVSAQAKGMRYDIPEPISFSSFVNDPSLRFQYSAVYIDDLDWFFKSNFGVVVACATIIIPIDSYL